MIKLKDLLHEQNNVKDIWGRPSTSKWYGFDPRTKKYTIGANKGKTYAEVMKAKDPSWIDRTIKSVSDWADKKVWELEAWADETVENIKNKGIEWFYKNETILLVLYKKLTNYLGNPGSILWIILKVHNAFWGSKGKKIRLIFPSRKDWEIETVKLFKRLGVITTLFKSVPHAIATVNALAAKGVKATELIIGSHGDGQLLVIPADRNYRFNDNFMAALKNIITTQTKVFFTACHGADYLYTLVTAANQIGVNGVYGASGIYNPATNTAEKGFYYCQAVSESRLKLLAKKSGEKNYKSNNFLLKSGIGKKISSSPISFLNTI
jgi:hypothetical protein